VGVEIHFLLYKNSKYKAQFYQINELIEKEIKKYTVSLDFDIYEDCDEISLSFQDNSTRKDYYGLPNLSCIIGSSKLFTMKKPTAILDFWEYISKKYFFDEPVLIDQSEIYARDECYMLYKGEKIEPDIPIGIAYLVQQYFTIIFLRTYDKPFSYVIKK
jgi:hypothetical protein